MKWEYKIVEPYDFEGKSLEETMAFLGDECWEIFQVQEIQSKNKDYYGREYTETDHRIYCKRQLQ